MDGRTLLQIISKDEKAKQFWEKFSGKDILDELFKHPELLGMQDTKYTTATKEEKDFFVKCMFSVSTENGFKFEREERVFDSFYEKLGQYIRIILKQKLIVALEERMIDSLVKQIRSLPSKVTEPAVALCSWINVRPNVDLPQPDSPMTPNVSPS